MTIDEAIKYYLDIADGQNKCAEICVSEHAKERISQCAADHRQLAEWLTNYKEAIRLLKWAVEGFRKLGVSLNDDGECDGDCLYCPINNHGNCLKWEYESEALALIGEEGDTNG